MIVCPYVYVCHSLNFAVFYLHTFTAPYIFSNVPLWKRYPAAIIMYIRLITSAICMSDRVSVHLHAANIGTCWNMVICACDVYTNVGLCTLPHTAELFVFTPSYVEVIAWCVQIPNKYAESERIQISIFIEF